MEQQSVHVTVNTKSMIPYKRIQRYYQSKQTINFPAFPGSSEYLSLRLEVDEYVSRQKQSEMEIYHVLIEKFFQC